MYSIRMQSGTPAPETPAVTAATADAAPASATWRVANSTYRGEDGRVWAEFDSASARACAGGDGAGGGGDTLVLGAMLHKAGSVLGALDRAPSASSAAPCAGTGAETPGWGEGSCQGHAPEGSPGVHTSAALQARFRSAPLGWSDWSEAVSLSTFS